MEIPVGLLILFIAQVWSQGPNLKILGFDPLCPIVGTKVVMKAEVDMTNVNTSVWSVRVALVNVPGKTEIAVTFLDNRCETLKLDLQCEKQNGTDIYNVFLENSAVVGYSGQNFTLRMVDHHSLPYNWKKSPEVPYPIVADTISEALKVEDNNVILHTMECIKHPEKSVFINYIVNGLVLEYVVSILDKSSNVLVDSISRPEVSTTIPSDTEVIYVKYNMPGSCSKITRVCFGKEATEKAISSKPHDNNHCGKLCKFLIICGIIIFFI